MSDLVGRECPCCNNVITIRAVMIDSISKALLESDPENWCHSKFYWRNEAIKIYDKIAQLEGENKKCKM